MRREPRPQHDSIVPVPPLVERQMILVDHQRSIRQIFRSAYIETVICVAFVGIADVMQAAATVRLTLGIDVQLPRAGIRPTRIPVIHSNDGATAYRVWRVRWPRTGLSCTEPQGVSAIRHRSLARS